MVLGKGPLLTPAPEPPLTASQLLPVCSQNSQPPLALHGYRADFHPGQGRPGPWGGGSAHLSLDLPCVPAEGHCQPSPWSDGQSHPQAGIVRWPRPGKAPPAAGASPAAEERRGCALLAAQTRTWSVPESLGQAGQPVEGWTAPPGPQQVPSPWPCLVQLAGA